MELLLWKNSKAVFKRIIWKDIMKELLKRIYQKLLF